MGPVYRDAHQMPSTAQYRLADWGGGSDVVSVACFGVRVSVMFHLMFVHYTLSSFWVAEWPPFGK